MSVLENTSRIIKKPGYNTWLIVIPADIVTDSAFPLKNASEVTISINDNKLEISKAA